MKTIVVASENPVKLRATRQGFTRMFPHEDFTFLTVNVPSGVPDQPMSDAETSQGAMLRAQNAAKHHPDADYWVGIEGGVDFQTDGLQAFAWVVVLSRDRTGRGKTGTFYLPDDVARLVRAGKELGDADDIVFGRHNSKQQNGAVGLLTGDVIDRTGFYEQAVIMALIPFRNTGFSF